MRLKRPADHIISCEDCGKRGYLNRATARRARRRMPDRRTLRPYRCGSCGYWHLGRLPQATQAGLLTATEVYQDRRAA